LTLHKVVQILRDTFQHRFSQAFLSAPLELDDMYYEHMNIEKDVFIHFQQASKGFPVALSKWGEIRNENWKALDGYLQENKKKSKTHNLSVIQQLQEAWDEKHNVIMSLFTLQA
jgi:thiamine pyrophosphate-dependent acetolactate synthase large subunit-like protein